MDKVILQSGVHTVHSVVGTQTVLIWQHDDSRVSFYNVTADLSQTLDPTDLTDSRWSEVSAMIHGFVTPNG